MGAKLANGLLTIELQREIPEEKKARAIPVVAGLSRPDALTVAGRAPRETAAPFLCLRRQESTTRRLDLDEEILARQARAPDPGRARQVLAPNAALSAAAMALPSFMWL